MSEPTKELTRSLAALYLATDASIADDVLLKVNTVVRDLTQRAEAAEAERDDIIAICRGTQMDDAAIHSMRGYVTQKLRIEAERDALRKALLLCDRTCDFIAHSELERHGLGEECPVAARITAALVVQP